MMLVRMNTTGVMKMKSSVWCLSAVLSVMALPAWADNPACQYRAAEIQNQIDYARQHGNEHRERGLQRALANVQMHCRDADLLRDVQEDIREQEEEIQDRLDEIAEKRSEGRQDKVQKLEKKLERDRAKLEQLQDELKELQALSAK
jgi:predicted RNase H-like nuclease (RuvC/YqgF family)